MNLKAKVFTVAVAITGLILISGDLHAQKGRKQAGGPGLNADPKMAERMDTLKLVRLVDLLKLSDEQALKVSKAMKDHREKMVPLRNEMKKIAQSLKTLTEAEKPQVKAIQEKVAAYRAVVKKFPEEREKFIESVIKILDSVQQGKFVLFHENFPNELRKHMQEFGARGMRGRGTLQGQEQPPEPLPNDTEPEL